MYFSLKISFTCESNEYISITDSISLYKHKPNLQNRRKIGLNCWKRLARSTSADTRTPCAARASTVTCFVCMSCRNTWKSTRRSWRRCWASRGDCRRRRRRTAKRPVSIWTNIRMPFRPVADSGRSPTTDTAFLTSSPARISSFFTSPPRDRHLKRFDIFPQFFPFLSETFPFDFLLIFESIFQDSNRFSDGITKALDDMRKLFGL